MRKKTDMPKVRVSRLHDRMDERTLEDSCVLNSVLACGSWKSTGRRIVQQKSVQNEYRKHLDAYFII